MFTDMRNIVKGGDKKMKTYGQLDKEKKEKVDMLLTECEVFFAFSGEQFREGLKKVNASKTNKVTSIGGGGYVPVKHVKKLEKGFEDIEKWYDKEEKKIKVIIKRKRISEKKYHDMMDVLPPIFHPNGVFQVSEPYNHITVKGKECATYSTYQEKNGRYYSLGILTRQQAREYATS